MIRYLILLAIYIPFYILAMLLAPVLPAFAYPRWGQVNNNNGYDVGPRLPTWLSWFDTEDNSLWGDGGWRTEHCPKYWDTYLGEVLWLWRNPACGFTRNILTYTVQPDTTFTVIDSGNGLDVDKAHNTGWFKITASNGAWHYRWVKSIGFGKIACFESGWGLDDYIKTPEFLVTEPKASFSFSPQVKTQKSS